MRWTARSFLETPSERRFCGDCRHWTLAYCVAVEGLEGDGCAFELPVEAPPIVVEDVSGRSPILASGDIFFLPATSSSQHQDTANPPAGLWVGFRAEAWSQAKPIGCRHKPELSAIWWAIHPGRKGI